MGAFLSPTFKVGVDFADIWRILFVMCDLRETDRNQAKTASRENHINRLNEQTCYNVECPRPLS